ncbi:uncharacterized protein [Watersipora subatra]|uniref:uncharacterized protein n=1 Tax=Watersipora subatra TaxID=2589382 RepID=UPI00355C77C7
MKSSLPPLLPPTPDRATPVIMIAVYHWPYNKHKLESEYYRMAYLWSSAVLARSSRAYPKTEGQLFEAFYLELRQKAQKCQFGYVESDLIRDRIVLGIHEDCTRKKLIALGNNLTLEEAVKICRSQELAARAMKDISSQALTSDLPTKPVKAVFRSSRRQKPAHVSKPSVGKSGTCGYCGGTTHPRSQCPARSDRCKECIKGGHWGKACRSAIYSKRVNLAETESDGPAEETLFCEDLKIDSVHNHPGWSATIEIDKTPVKFKLDSGADASVMKITEPMVQRVNLDQARSRLRGPGNHSINCLGTFTACFRYGRKSTNETIYVIANQNTNLLSREACKNLGLLTCNVYQVETDIETIYQQYPTAVVPNLFFAFTPLQNFQIQIPPGKSEV